MLNIKTNKIRAVPKKRAGLSQIIEELVKYTVMLFTLITSSFPIIWVLMSSFKTHKEIFASSVSLPSKISFIGYVDALKMAPIQKYYLNSFIVATTATLANVLIVSLSAYVIARYNFKFKNAIIILMASALLLPMQALAYPIFQLVHGLGLLDTKAALIIIYTALGLPVTFYILRSYFLSIPKDIEEASYIDGSGFLRSFIVIMLPIAKPGLATAAILQFLWNWNEFFFALILTSGQEARTLPLSLSYFISRFSFNYTAMFAAIIMVIAPSILVFVVLQRQVISSLTAGAVKG